MNEEQFKRHLRDLVHGHHHPEEHDWGQPGNVKKAATRRKRPAGRKTSKRK